VLDSIVDGLDGVAIAADATNRPGPPATLERVTILGRTFFRKLPLASEVIFTTPSFLLNCNRVVCDSVSFPAVRRHHSAIAVSRLAIATGDRTRGAERSGIRCPQEQIKLEIQQRLVPSFTSTHYGHPGYCQLRLSGPIEIRTRRRGRI